MKQAFFSRKRSCGEAVVTDDDSPGAVLVLSVEDDSVHTASGLPGWPSARCHLSVLLPPCRPRALLPSALSLPSLLLLPSSSVLSVHLSVVHMEASSEGLSSVMVFLVPDAFERYTTGISTSF